MENVSRRPGLCLSGGLKNREVLNWDGEESAECGVRSAECGVRSAEGRGQSAEGGVQRAENREQRAACGGWRVELTEYFVF